VTHPMLISVVEVINIPVGLEGLMRWQPALHTACEKTKRNEAKKKRLFFVSSAVSLWSISMEGNLPRQTGSGQQP
jgi:hypothetical protein